MKRYYPATVTQDEGGAYIVQAIDLDNVFSEGATIPEAVSNAEDALVGVLDVMAEHGDTIPDPTPIDMAEVKRHSYGDIIALVHLAAPAAKAKAVRLSVTMDEDLVKRIDGVAGHYGRSEFLASAAREKLVQDSGVMRRTQGTNDKSLAGKPVPGRPGYIYAFSKVPS